MESKQPTNSTYADRNAQQRYHGAEPVRGLEDVPHSTLYEGRFGRMFRNLPPCTLEDSELVALAEEKGALFWKAFVIVLQGWLFILTGNASKAAQMIASGIAGLRSTGATFRCSR